MIYVLDTNAWSDAFRGGKVQRKLSVVPVSRVLLAAPVLYELRRGVVKANAKALKQAVDDLVSTYETAAFDGAAADAAADVSQRMAAKGRTLPHLDTMIAGIAIARSAVMVTRDKDLKGISGLHTENWA